MTTVAGNIGFHTVANNRLKISAIPTFFMFRLGVIL